MTIDTGDKPLHSYILLRSDMPLEAQMAQCAHAAQEAAFLLDAPPQHPIHVVILSCPNEVSLLAAAERLAKKGIEAGLFYEPDWPRGHTALYSRPQTRSSKLRAAMAAYPLWTAPTPVSAPLAPAIRVVATDNPLNATIEISEGGEAMARVCHLLQRTGMQLFDRAYFLRKRLEAAGIAACPDLDALDSLADLIDYSAGLDGLIKACDAHASGYANFRQHLAEAHVGDCTAVACSCTRCWAESALGVDTAPSSRAVGHRMLCEQMALAKQREPLLGTVASPGTLAPA